MKGYLETQKSLGRQWFGQLFEFLVERFVLGSLAAAIVYAGYRMFLL